MPIARPYADTADRARVLALRDATLTPQTADQYPTAADLSALLDALEGDAPVTRVWEDAAHRLQAFALLHLPYANLYCYFDPATRTADLESAVVTWAIQRLRAANAQDGESRTLDAHAREDDPHRVAFLERQGFRRQADHTVRMARALADPLPPPVVPSGYTVRPLAGEAEAPALVALHRAAYGTTHLTLEDRLARMRQPDYHPAYDWVAVAPDGTLAAYVAASRDSAVTALHGRNEGEIDTVATHPAHRNQGLARALLLMGLRALHAQGVTTALLGTESDSPAQRLYEAAGFRVISRQWWYTRTVE
jgi:ribosomal protein S18 acetylase RimI-like enzyme